jgi:hypothetical protein
MLKWSRRENDENGIAATPHGALAIECPACPHPGKNLPEDWETVYRHKPCVLYDYMILYKTDFYFSHLHAQFLAIDANFRLKQKERGFHLSGTLGPGWAYFVDPLAFSHELRRAATTTQISEVRDPSSRILIPDPSLAEYLRILLCGDRESQLSSKSWICGHRSSRGN